MSDDGSDKIGDLMVWWIPQVPMKSFEVKVSSIAEGALIMSTLSAYDEFQFRNRIKPDYCNMGGLMVFADDGDGAEWVDWHDEESGVDDPRDWVEQHGMLVREDGEKA